MSSSKKRLQFDKASPLHPDNHLAFGIVAAIVTAIALGVFFFCYSIAQDYLTAPYHADVTATLTSITEGEQEKWEYTESKEEARDPNHRATRTYKESVYGFHWTYTIDGREYVWDTTDVSSTAHHPGDTMEMRFWSNDGVEYHRSYHGTVNYAFMNLAVIAAAAGAAVILTILVVRILLLIRKRRKKRLRIENERRAALNRQRREQEQRSDQNNRV